MKPTRRAFLATAGTAVAALAGCSTPETSGGSKLPTEPNYRGWFDGVSNYEGTDDFRGQSAVTVRVGVQGGLGYFKYGPPAVAVSPGTTVTWEWTGEGGAHDVVAERGAFDSGEAVRSDTETFEHTFERPAIYRYYCTPHADLGMRGAVFVALGQ